MRPNGDQSRSLDPLNGVDANAVFAWLDKHCRENPLQKIGFLDVSNGIEEIG